MVSEPLEGLWLKFLNLRSQIPFIIQQPSMSSYRKQDEKANQQATVEMLQVKTREQKQTELIEKKRLLMKRLRETE